MLFIVALMPGATTLAGPPDAQGCHTHKDCGVGNNDDSSASYKIAVYFGGNTAPDGEASGVEGSGNESRPKIRNTIMEDLNLTEMSMVLGAECEAVFGNVTMIDGEFGFSTSKIPKTSLTFTYITASFWNFTVNGSVYFLVFGPDDDDAAIGDEENWPPTGDEYPGNENYMSGNLLELKVINGPAKKGPCDKLLIELDWEIVVTKEPV